MKKTSARTEPRAGQVHELGPHNVAALAALLGEGNGVYVVTVHKGRVVKYARVERPVQVLPAEEAEGVGGQA